MIKKEDNEDVTVLGVNIFSRNIKEGLEKVKKYLEKAESQKSKVKSNGLQPFVILTPNPEIVIYAQKDRAFKDIVNRADLTLPDGIGIVWTARFLNDQVSFGRIAGVDFMEGLSALAAKKGLGIGLIGGRKGVALKALECLQGEFSGLRGWTLGDLQVEVEDNKHLIKVKSQKSKVKNISKKLKVSESLIKAMHFIIDKIVAKDTAILFVGLGHPKQEYFIDLLRRELIASGYREPLVMMAVGGAFDYISGGIPRAPAGMREAGLEWLYRLARQPWRVRRQLALLEFVFLTIKARLENRAEDQGYVGDYGKVNMGSK